ncbi:cilia- and flagella-associated protein 68 [Chanos chanos]|uniref:Cilia- and flagella-associated protein 68 n=1 Tax=Chanos chanos TaxID=29144 RepID=A0A6J2WXC4_CHACN|nr:UPF0686 protein C11orf1 homolog [Chanos chanos]
MGSPPFHYMLRASGQSEVWYDFTAECKFRQYGWRCSTSEDAYSTATLIGNWSEQRFDTRHARAAYRPLPSQFSHYFETTYSSTYNKGENRPIHRTLGREPRSFPGHQPELDPPHTKGVPNSCYRLDFREHVQNNKSEESSPYRQTSAGHPPSQES